VLYNEAPSGSDAQKIFEDRWMELHLAEGWTQLRWRKTVLVFPTGAVFRFYTKQKCRTDSNSA
jgi:hypothetical protein